MLMMFVGLGLSKNFAPLREGDLREGDLDGDLEDVVCASSCGAGRRIGISCIGFLRGRPLPFFRMLGSTAASCLLPGV